MMWFVYILRCADSSLYTGITTDVNKRLRQHNGQASGGAKYTRSRRPCILERIMPRPSRSGAARLEMAIKSMPKWRKEELIRNATTV